MIITDINGNTRHCVKAYPDPSYPGFIKVEYKNARRSYQEWYPINDFMANNPNFANETGEIKRQAPDTTGMVSSTTNITLSDKNKGWEPDSYRGFPVWISQGKGEGQVRNIISNSKDTLIIDREWEVKPNKYSHYLVSRNISDDMPETSNVSPEELQHDNELEAKKIEEKNKKAQNRININKN